MIPAGPRKKRGHTPLGPSLVDGTNSEKTGFSGQRDLPPRLPVRPRCMDSHIRCAHCCAREHPKPPYFYTPPPPAKTKRQGGSQNISVELFGVKKTDRTWGKAAKRGKVRQRAYRVIRQEGRGDCPFINHLSNPL